MKSQLFGIEPTDPLTLVIAAGTLALVGLLAGYIPARRAAKRPAGPGAAVRIGQPSGRPVGQQRCGHARSMAAVFCPARFRVARPSPKPPIRPPAFRWWSPSAARRIISNLRYDADVLDPGEGGGAASTGTNTMRFSLGDTQRAARDRLRDQPRARQERRRPTASRRRFEFVNGHIVVPAAALSDRRRTRSRSSSRPATRRSTAIPISSTRCSCRRARTWRSRCSINRI